MAAEKGSWFKKKKAVVGTKQLTKDAISDPCELRHVYHLSQEDAPSTNNEHQKQLLESPDPSPEKTKKDKVDYCKVSSVSTEGFVYVKKTVLQEIEQRMKDLGEKVETLNLSTNIIDTGETTTKILPPTDANNCNDYENFEPLYENLRLGDVNLRRTGQSAMSPPANRNARPDERECLSDALRTHVVAIVDNVDFRESELPDALIEDSCISEDECEVIRQHRSRRDQVRMLLTFIRGRDLTVLHIFLSKLQQDNTDIAERVKKTFEENQEKKVRPLQCSRCTLIERVNVKYVSDRLFEIRAIGEGLYNEIVFDEKPVGAQRQLWIRVVDTLNALPTKDRAEAFDVLGETLGKKYYKYIQADIKKSMKNDPSLVCQCRIRAAGPRASYPSSSPSPRSSTSGGSRDSKDVGEP